MFWSISKWSREPSKQATTGQERRHTGRNVETLIKRDHRCRTAPRSVNYDHTHALPPTKLVCLHQQGRRLVDADDGHERLTLRYGEPPGASGRRDQQNGNTIRITKVGVRHWGARARTAYPARELAVGEVFVRSLWVVLHLAKSSRMINSLLSSPCRFDAMQINVNLGFSLQSPDNAWGTRPHLVFGRVVKDDIMHKHDTHVSSNNTTSRRGIRYWACCPCVGHKSFLGRDAEQ